MAETMEKVEEREGSWTEKGQRPEAADHAAPEYARILDVFQEPILLLDRDHRILYGNRAAREKFEFQPNPPTCYATFRGRECACEDCPAGDIQAGETVPIKLVKDEKKHRLSIHRLSEPLGDAWYVLRLESSGSGTGLDPEAVRRMKHRFNNYLAPMAGQAEIITCALQAGTTRRGTRWVPLRVSGGAPGPFLPASQRTTPTADSRSAVPPPVLGLCSL